MRESSKGKRKRKSYLKKDSQKWKKKKEEDERKELLFEKKEKKKKKPTHVFSFHPMALQLLSRVGAPRAAFCGVGGAIVRSVSSVSQAVQYEKHGDPKEVLRFSSFVCSQDHRDADFAAWPHI